MTDDTTFPAEAARLKCEVRDPAGVVRAVFGPSDEWAQFSAEQGRMGYEAVKLTIPSTHPVLQQSYTLNGSAKTFYERPARWTLWVVYRDYDWRDAAILGASRNDCFAKASVIAMEDEDVSEGGTTTDDIVQMVTITGIGLCDRTIGQRQTMHASWARYRKDGGPISASYFVKHLVDDQTDDSKRPAGYTGLGVSATNYGSLTRGGATVLESSVATTLSFLRIDSGQSVLDTARELSKAYNIGWSYRVSPTANTWRLHLYDGQGTSRTSSVIFSRSAGNLVSVKRALDYSGESNVSWVAGKGTRERQLSRIGWSSDATSVALFGVLETGERHDSAWDNEATVETAALGAHIAGTYEHWEAEIRDTDDLYFGMHYGVFDTVTCTDEARGLSFAKYIVVAQVNSSSPSRIRLLLGDIPSHFNEIGGGGGRSGRGGVGHRRAGGTTAPLVTEQEVPQRWCPEDGEIVHATQANTPFQLIPDTSASRAPCNPIHTYGVNNGEAEDKVGQLMISSCEWEVAPPPPPPVDTVTGDIDVEVEMPIDCCTQSQFSCYQQGRLDNIPATFCFGFGQTIGRSVISCSDPECCADSCTVATTSGTEGVDDQICVDGWITLPDERFTVHCETPPMCIECTSAVTGSGTFEVDVPGQYEFDTWSAKCVDDGTDRVTVKSPGVRSGVTCTLEEPEPCPAPSI